MDSPELLLCVLLCGRLVIESNKSQQGHTIDSDFYWERERERNASVKVKVKVKGTQVTEYKWAVTTIELDLTVKWLETSPVCTGVCVVDSFLTFTFAFIGCSSLLFVEVNST